MNEYTASNGYEIIQREVEPNAYELDIFDETLEPHEVDALREFFQHERDEQLGRWRWPENPDYVVYARERGWLVVHETSGARLYTTSANRSRETDLDRALADYLNAHPEPKPWESAKNGEIWELRKEPKQQAIQYLYDEGRFFRLPLLTPTEPGWEPASFASEFAAGRRIWPEVTS